MKRLHLILYAIALSLSLQMVSCIEPELNLSGETTPEILPAIEIDMNVMWDIDAEWSAEWYYGWDEKDDSIWGGIGYDEPKSYQVRRYFTGDDPRARHTEVDAFSIEGTSFRRLFSYGYYDMLFWNDIESKDGTQVLVINETLDSVTATTTGTHALAREVFNMVGSGENVSESEIVGLKNQPEILYSAYTEDVLISRDLSDYVYDPVENVYLKTIETELRPLVYIYLVQIVLFNNDGRIKGINGNTAMSSMASGVNLNTGHTNNIPSVVYFNTRLKRNIEVDGRDCDVMGGKFTTFGLCDMEPYTRSDSNYSGSRGDLKNYLLFDLVFTNNGVKTYSVDVTDQCQKQAHGGVITVFIDCGKLELPDDPEIGTGSLFIPTIEDYSNVNWEIEF